jgi:hypothetical protein
LYNPASDHWGEERVLNRREFQLSLFKLSAAALFAPRLFARAQVGANESPKIAELYKSAIVMDSLCGPFLDPDKFPSAEEVTVVRESGITAVNWTVSDHTFEGTVKNFAWLEAD